MAVKLWGPMLTGLAQGFQDYQTQQEDLSYTRQMRMNQLAGQQLQNQDQSLKNQAAQQQLQNASLTHNYWVNALQDNGTGAGDAAASQAAPQGGANVAQGGGMPQQQQQGGGNAPAQVTYGNFKPNGPLSVQQLKGLDDKYGLPSGTAYGLMSAESSGNPNAVSNKGAQGLFQVMPSTAAQPGYGLKPFDPKDPDGAMSYFAKMYQKAGGDMSKALAYWNAGPGGNPNNPETQGFIPKVQKGMQQFASANSLDQSRQQPTPADQITAREAAGANTPVTAYQQATQAQGQQIQTMLRAAQNADKDGHPELAQSFRTQASALQDQQIALQKKSLDVQKDANTQTEKLAGGVNDQSSYNNFRQQIAQNPAMQSAVAGLNLTGDYSLDRNKLQTIADRATSLKDQQELALKQSELQLKQQTAQRAQQKEDQPRIAQQQAIAQDTTRKQTLTAKGIPFAPSITATAPVGTTQAQLQQAQKQIATQNAAYDKANAPVVAGSKNVRDQAAQAFVMVDKGGLDTGGVGMGMRESIGGPLLDAKQQEFVKLTNGLIQSMQQMAAANGGARSAGTAAMYANFARAKPNLTLSPEANKVVAHGLYVGAASQVQMNQYLDEFRQANPDAPVQAGVMAYRSYEQALGPTLVFDPATKSMVPNMAGIPNLEDGSPNPNYKDYHVFFAQGHF
jgi:soluble lytic murein transglycosylase-like protein